MKKKWKKIIIAFLVMMSVIANNSSYAQCESTHPLPLNNIINVSGCFNLDRLMTPAGTTPAPAVTVKVDLSKVEPTTIHIGTSMTNPIWTLLPSGYSMPNGYSIDSSYLLALKPGPYDVSGNQGIIGVKVNFIATPKIQFEVDGIWSTERYIVKNEAIEALLGATRARVILPAFFTYTNSAVWNRFYQNGTQTAYNQASYSINENANYRIITGDGTGPSSLDTTNFQLMFQEEHIPVTGVSISPTTKALVVGEKFTPTVTIAPSNATNKNVVWGTSNPSVASVDGGTIIAIAAGTTSITVTTEDGNFTAQCVVSVENATVPVTGVSLNKTSATLATGSNETLTATVVPANATNKNVVWTSNNPAVATVSNGKVNAIAAGETTVKVTTEDGNFTATCTVTVQNPVVPVTGVTINKSTTSLTVGGSETLTATVSPSNATNQTVVWTSNNPAVASVDGGTVNFVGVGSAVITVTTQDGGFTATCAVTVNAVEPVPPVPVFDGLAEEYTAGSPAVPLKVKGVGSEHLTIFKVNGQVTGTFNPATKGDNIIEASSADGKLKIKRKIIVK
jgi:uncharacterized protein YjdB